MKTQEEIKELAEKYWAKQPYNEDAYVVGYTQCQEDMVDYIKHVLLEILKIN
jgi:hypothetical protein